MEVTIDMGWISTDGVHIPTRCDIITEDEGHTFFCKTHHAKCVFDEGHFCPSIFGAYE